MAVILLYKGFVCTQAQNIVKSVYRRLHSLNGQHFQHIFTILGKVNETQAVEQNRFWLSKISILLTKLVQTHFENIC